MQKAGRVLLNISTGITIATFLAFAISLLVTLVTMIWFNVLYLSGVEFDRGQSQAIGDWLVKAIAYCGIPFAVSFISTMILVNFFYEEDNVKKI